MTLDLAITTDYRADRGEISETLSRIATTGFTHVIWCHHWGDDFSYVQPEIRHINKSLQRNKLKIIDIHGSAGNEKDWTSPIRYKQDAGILLVKNRIDFLLELPYEATGNNSNAYAQTAHMAKKRTRVRL